MWALKRSRAARARSHARARAGMGRHAQTDVQMRALTCARAPAPQVCALVGGEGLKAISPTLYLLFWSLSLYDLEVPVQR